MVRYKVDKSVPMPPLSSKGRPRKYPMLDMEIGDSFSVPEEEENRVKTAAQYYKREHGLRFCTRKYKEGGKTRVRVWRVE